MPFDKKAYMKAYRQANKEKIAAQQKAHDDANKDKKAAQRKARDKANKEKIAAQQKAWKEANKERIKAQRKARYETNKDRLTAQRKEYYKTEAGIKNMRMSGWRKYGVNNVNDELYDYFMSCDKCEVCGKEFTDTYNKCLDHDHDTGDFRYVLCRPCNNNDGWKKYITAI